MEGEVDMIEWWIAVRKPVPAAAFIGLFKYKAAHCLYLSTTTSNGHCRIPNKLMMFYQLINYILSS